MDPNETIEQKQLRMMRDLYNQRRALLDDAQTQIGRLKREQEANQKELERAKEQISILQKEKEANQKELERTKTDFKSTKGYLEDCSKLLNTMRRSEYQKKTLGLANPEVNTMRNALAHWHEPFTTPYTPNVMYYKKYTDLPQEIQEEDIRFRSERSERDRKIRQAQEEARLKLEELNKKLEDTQKAVKKSQKRSRTGSSSGSRTGSSSGSRTGSSSGSRTRSGRKKRRLTSQGGDPRDLTPPDYRPPDYRPPDYRPPDYRPPDYRPPDYDYRQGGYYDSAPPGHYPRNHYDSDPPVYHNSTRRNSPQTRARNSPRTRARNSPQTRGQGRTGAHLQPSHYRR